MWIAHDRNLILTKLTRHKAIHKTQAFGKVSAFDANYYQPLRSLAIISLCARTPADISDNINSVIIVTGELPFTIGNDCVATAVVAESRSPFRLAIYGLYYTSDPPRHANVRVSSLSFARLIRALFIIIARGLFIRENFNPGSARRSDPESSARLRRRPIHINAIDRSRLRRSRGPRGPSLSRFCRRMSKLCLLFLAFHNEKELRGGEEA